MKIPLLRDPVLRIAAEGLNDLEESRIAAENRLAQFTRTEPDSDGVMRGLAMPKNHPDVLRLQEICELLREAEDEAIDQLEAALKRNPLGAWVKRSIGIGTKQGARLLAAVDDPYWHPEERPTTMSQFRAYCGYHTVPSSPEEAENTFDIRPGAWIAPRRKKGEKANWNPEAKKRLYLIALSCLKAKKTSPYGAVYDRAKAKASERTHAVPCIRCGPSGKPAAVGTPWSKAHQHAHALRIVSKTICDDLWREAERLHLAAGHDTYEWPPAV